MSVARLEPKRMVRCAIYTRKSSENGLELDFNSLLGVSHSSLAERMVHLG